MTEQPVEFALRRQERELEIAFFCIPRYRLPYEFLLVYSPTAGVHDHDSGLYTWEYLLHPGNNQGSMWQDLLQRIKEAGASRAPTR